MIKFSMKNPSPTISKKELISPDKLQSALADIETAYQEYLNELEELQKERQKQSENNPAS